MIFPGQPSSRASSSASIFRFLDEPPGDHEDMNPLGRSSSLRKGIVNLMLSTSEHACCVSSTRVVERLMSRSWHEIRPHGQLVKWELHASELVWIQKRIQSILLPACVLSELTEAPAHVDVSVVDAPRCRGSKQPCQAHLMLFPDSQSDGRYPFVPSCCCYSL